MFYLNINILLFINLIKFKHFIFQLFQFHKQIFVVLKTQNTVRNKKWLYSLTKQIFFYQKQEAEKVVLRPMAKITHKGVIAINEDLSDMAANISNNNNQV